MGKNFWGDLSELEEKRNPLDILKEQSGYLLNATNNLIFADLKNREPIPLIGEPNKQFATIFSIRSKMMEKYVFELFTLFYNITFFPLIVELDENISEALNISTTLSINNEDEFHQLLEDVLGNSFTKNVIASLYSMSK
ncbi:hypothetical protein [Neobacillus massiliamazoniensis]|uniref:Uncharacterized protein n=1 Tax=Neobacillus massiliamazoniensis TaxID=1499688 RepID=A0A0U1NQH5_9BACI|nr:hypothetical protein [Neobacillus massiliamazoniensis]CRK80290.1 hypothetical protein BN000_00171 [Neobacillus massiliamazoniensis]